jgi:hypothetical protein
MNDLIEILSKINRSYDKINENVFSNGLLPSITINNYVERI